MKSSLLIKLIFIPFSLFMTPILFWIFSWRWSELTHYNDFDHFLFWITETGNAPLYAGVTSLILSVILSFICRRHMNWMIIFLSVFILQLSTQVIKSGLKFTFAEPRPYMSYLIKEGVTPTEFYSQNRKKRAEIVTETVANDHNTPVWLKQHWAKETGFSFPSGHTTFAVTWLCIFLGFLSTRSRINKIAISIIYIWSLLMIVSRLVLGMHFPIDVFIGTLFPPILCYFYFGWLSKNIGSIKKKISRYYTIR